MKILKKNKIKKKEKLFITSGCFLFLIFGVSLFIFHQLQASRYQEMTTNYVQLGTGNPREVNSVFLNASVKYNLILKLEDHLKCEMAWLVAANGSKKNKEMVITADTQKCYQSVFTSQETKSLKEKLEKMATESFEFEFYGKSLKADVDSLISAASQMLPKLERIKNLKLDLAKRDPSRAEFESDVEYLKKHPELANKNSLETSTKIIIPPPSAMPYGSLAVTPSTIPAPPKLVDKKPIPFIWPDGRVMK
jgi:hypothetical protein